MAKKKNIKDDDFSKEKLIVNPTKFVAHEDDWVPLVSPYSAPEIIWAVRGKCQHLLSDGWVYAWEYLRTQAHEFWKTEVEHKKLMDRLHIEMNNPKYNGRSK